MVGAANRVTGLGEGGAGSGSKTESDVGHSLTKYLTKYLLKVQYSNRKVSDFVVCSPQLGTGKLNVLMKHQTPSRFTIMYLSRFLSLSAYK